MPGTELTLLEIICFISDKKCVIFSTWDMFLDQCHVTVMVVDLQLSFACVNLVIAVIQLSHVHLVLPTLNLIAFKNLFRKITLFLFFFLWPRHMA